MCYILDRALLQLSKRLVRQHRGSPQRASRHTIRLCLPAALATTLASTTPTASVAAAALATALTATTVAAAIATALTASAIAAAIATALPAPITTTATALGSVATALAAS